MGFSEVYGTSPDWLKLLIVVQPTIWVWSVLAIVLLVQRWRLKAAAADASPAGLSSVSSE